MSSCLPPACARAHPQDAGVVAVAEDEPEVVARGRSASAALLLRGRRGGCLGSGLCSQNCVLRAGGLRATGSGSWPGVDLQIPRWTVASLLTCSCFPCSRLLDKENRGLAPSWLMAALPEGHPRALCQSPSPSSPRRCVICSVQCSTGSTNCPGGLSARPVSLLSLPA